MSRGRNVDLFAVAAGARFPSECAAQVDKQRLLLWDAAAFLLSHQLPAVVRIFLNAWGLKRWALS